MKRYAIKIGEIIISSEKPITQEQREKIINILVSRGEDVLQIDDVYLRVNSH